MYDICCMCTTHGLPHAPGKSQHPLLHLAPLPPRGPVEVRVKIRVNLCGAVCSLYLGMHDRFIMGLAPTTACSGLLLCHSPGLTGGSPERGATVAPQTHDCVLIGPTYHSACLPIQEGEDSGHNHGFKRKGRWGSAAGTIMGFKHKIDAQTIHGEIEKTSDV